MHVCNICQYMYVYNICTYNTGNVPHGSWFNWVKVWSLEAKKYPDRWNFEYIVIYFIHVYVVIYNIIYRVHCVYM